MNRCERKILEEFESEFRALDDLREAIFRAHAARVEKERRDGGRCIGSEGGTRPMTELERRESAVNAIQVDILDARPLESFSARHLELLELMIAYWGELRDAEDAPINAPELDVVQ